MFVLKMYNITHKEYFVCFYWQMGIFFISVELLRWPRTQWKASVWCLSIRLSVCLSVLSRLSSLHTETDSPGSIRRVQRMFRPFSPMADAFAVANTCVICTGRYQSAVLAKYTRSELRTTTEGSSPAGFVTRYETSVCILCCVDFDLI